MHICAHNWMRPEPLAHSLRRLSSLGYTSIELAGEPDWYPVEETRALLQKYNIKCWGTVTIQYGTRDLTASDPEQRQATVQYMKDVVALSVALGGEITTIVPGRVGKTAADAGGLGRGRVEVGGRGATGGGGVRAVEEGPDRRRAPQPVRDALPEPRRPGASVGRCGRVRLRRRVRPVPSRARGGRHAGGDAGVRVAHRRLPRRGQQPAGRGDGSFDWPGIMATLAETGYDGGLAVECMPPIDRSPIGRFGAAQLETEPLDVPAGQLQFIVDHRSAVLSEAYYTQLLKTSAETMRKFI
ncbi:hypothetical protein PG987_006036 [Apiospora arundinis]